MFKYFFEECSSLLHLCGQEIILWRSNPILNPTYSCDKSTFRFLVKGPSGSPRRIIETSDPEMSK